MKRRICKWTPLREFASNYKANCGPTFYDSTESGAPITDWLRYCPFCGGHVELKKREPHQP